MFRKIVSFISAFTLFIPLVFAASFSDVPDNHPQNAAIESLKNLGIINGYSDGTFKPENPVNRAEALKMILASASIAPAATLDAAPFPDVTTGDWFAPYAQVAKEKGIIKGDGQTGFFVGARQVNKVEFLVMLIQSFQKDISSHQNLTAGISADTEAGQWFLPYLSYAKTLGLIAPTLDNLLQPDKLLTRAECAEIIYKLLLIERGGEAQKMLSIAETKLGDVLIALNNDDLQNALKNANDAVFYTEQAVKIAPDQGITKAANKIAQAFLELCLGYQAGLQGDNESLLKHAAEAENLAGLAYTDDPTTQKIGQKIKAQAEVLRGQIQTPQQ